MKEREKVLVNPKEVRVVQRTKENTNKKKGTVVKEHRLVENPVWNIVQERLTRKDLFLTKEETALM